MATASRAAEVMKRRLVDLGNAVPPSAAAKLASSSLGARFLRPLVNRFVPEAPTPIVVRSGPAQGIRLLADLRSEKFYWTGQHEVAVQQTLLSLLRPGMTFWDIGAHIGYFAILAGRAVGPTGHVHAFEPMPDSIQRLRGSITLNGLNNVSIHECALSAKNGKATFYAHSTSLISSLVAVNGQHKEVDVRCQTIDRMAESIGHSDVIKIDTEGVEVDVLRGGLQLFARCRPALLVEFTNDRVLQEARELVPFYTFRRLARRHWLLR